MTITVDLDRAEQAYVDAEVARLQVTNPSETAETFIARMTKKLVGKWASEQRQLSIDEIRSEFNKLTIDKRDEVLEVFRTTLEEAQQTGDVVGGGR